MTPSAAKPTSRHWPGQAGAPCQLHALRLRLRDRPAAGPRVRLLCLWVLERSWQYVGWESGRKCGDDEGEEEEDAERMRPSCVGDREESDPGHEASDREPRQQPWSEGGEQRARLSRPLGHALATAEVSTEHESEEQRERGEKDRRSREHGDGHSHERVSACSRLADRQSLEEDRRLRECPAGDDCGDGERGGVAGCLVALPPDERERRAAGDDRGDQADQAPALDETVVERLSVDTQHGQAGECDRPADETGRERAGAELPLERRFAQPGGVGAEETAARYAAVTT